MTDKQIIIDGVDVSGCPSIQSNSIGDVVCVRLARTSLYCKGQPCYYKALERKEQECEELKKLLKVRIEDLCDSCGASSMMPMPCKVYEKTLTEIKTDILYIREGISYFWVIDKCDEILQKISECEVGNV